MHEIQARALELIYDGHIPGNIILKQLCKKTYGLHKGFVKWHNGENGIIDSDEEEDHVGPHTHVSLILRGKPKLRMEGKHHLRYFGIRLAPKSKHLLPEVDAIIDQYDNTLTLPKLVAPLGKGNSAPMKKFTTYIDYLTDGHDNGFFEDTWNYKWDHEYEIMKTPQEKVFVKYCRGMSINDAIKSLKPRDRPKACLKYDEIRKMCNVWSNITTDASPRHELETFTEAARELVKDWNPKTESLVIQGEAAAGKTEFAKALLRSVTDKPAKLITDLNALKFRDTGEGILFDDMNFEAMKRTKRIHLLGIKNDAHIRILFGVHLIKAGTPRIFTTNEHMIDFMPLEDNALVRRVKVVNIDSLGHLY